MMRIREHKPLMWFGATALMLAVAVGMVSRFGPSAPASYYVAHLSPDSPAVDVYVGGKLSAAGLNYGQATTLQSNERNGEMLVEVRLAGTSPGSQALLSASVNLHPGTPYVIAVANRLARLQIGPYAIPVGDVPAGLARVQVLHAMPQSPRMGIRAGSNVIAPALGYLEETLPYLDVAPGSTRMLAFTDENPTTFLLDGTRDLPANAVTTVVIAGPPVQVIVFTTRVQ